MGAWSSGNSYNVGDAVSEGSSSYVALMANLAIDPATDVANSGGHWALLAKGSGVIPSTAVMQVIVNPNIYYNPLQSGQSSPLLPDSSPPFGTDNSYAWVPVACTLSALQAYTTDSTDSTLVVDLQYNSSASAGTLTDTGYFCTFTGPGAGSCNAPGTPLVLSAGSFLTLVITSDGGTTALSGPGAVWTSFGCQ